MFGVLLLAVTAPFASQKCSNEGIRPLLDALFGDLGSNCTSYAELFALDGQYFHQHDGYKNASQMLANCQAYAKFCTAGRCRFRQNGEAFVTEGSAPGSCLILAPYIWAEIPAAVANLEPHTGFEFINASADPTAATGFRMHVFAELETTYSVALDWAHRDSSIGYNRTVALLRESGGSNGECDAPVAPWLTAFLEGLSNGSDVWRQQGSAVLLATGGLCHVALPYAAELGGHLRSGTWVLALAPAEGSPRAYKMLGAVDFPLESAVAARAA
eukprot:Hpha_TRINITY_DN22967_c0_g1::TRINITY_DN22967_c0_g1_i1::g.154002::m.154002